MPAITSIEATTNRAVMKVALLRIAAGAAHASCLTMNTRAIAASTPIMGWIVRAKLANKIRMAMIAQNRLAN